MMTTEFIWDGRGERGDDARYSVLPGRAATDLALTAIHLRILAYLGRFNQRKGWCRLSQSDLAQTFGVRRQAVCTAVADLVDTGYIEKRGQAETGEPFCLYRTIIDEPEAGGVSAAPDTPGEGECRVDATPVSAVPDIRVRSRRTPVSALRTPYNDQSVEHVEMTDEGSADSKVRTDAARADRLPFTTAVLRHIEVMGVEPAGLIRRYEARTAGRRIKDPNAYLLGMARDEAAKLLGVPRSVVAKLTSCDMRERVAATVASVAGGKRRPAKASQELKRLMGGKGR